MPGQIVSANGRVHFNRSSFGVAYPSDLNCGHRDDGHSAASLRVERAVVRHRGTALFSLHRCGSSVRLQLAIPGHTSWLSVKSCKVLHIGLCVTALLGYYRKLAMSGMAKACIML